MNGLKTLSMRIRGYDEQTEEFSEDLATLSGEIADLTKVASNGNRGISLFEVGNPNQYRSTYDILKDIANIWDELTDKKQANLLEALFGKRQAQIGAAILSNFEQAEKAISTMEKSAGSAEREMEKIYASLEYKLNKFKETWVGIAQNLFDSDAIGALVDALTFLSSIVDKVTDVFGFLGTIGIAGAITWFVKLNQTMGRPEIEGFMTIMTVPIYTLVVTRNELAA